MGCSQADRRYPQPESAARCRDRRRVPLLGRPCQCRDVPFALVVVVVKAVVRPACVSRAVVVRPRGTAYGSASTSVCLRVSRTCSGESTW